MDPREFKTARKALGLKQHQIAAALNLDPKTISRFESGCRGTGSQTAKLMELVVRVPAVQEYLKLKDC